MNVLIVDDEPIELEQLSYLLSKKYPEWTVYEAEDAVQAKEILNKITIKLVFLDIQLPGESGLDLAKAIKKVNDNVQLIFISAHDNFEYAQRALRVHAFDFITKPVVQKEFYSVIDAYREKFGIHETKSSIVNAVMEYIKDNFNEKITLQEAAEFSHVSPSYLSRKFSEEMAMGFNDYLHFIRIEKAKQLIRERPDVSMAHIATEIGYVTQNHFNYQFKKHTGQTPSQYLRGR